MGLKKPNKGGIDTSDATATAFNIESPYTAYIKGKKTEGSLYAFDDSTTTPANMDYANNKLSHVFRSKRIQNAGSKINIDLSSLTGSAARVMEGDTVITKDGVTTGTHVCDGTVLPSLSNPATAQEIVESYEAIDQNGAMVTGGMQHGSITNNAIFKNTADNNLIDFYLKVAHGLGSDKVYFNSDETPIITVNKETLIPYCVDQYLKVFDNNIEFTNSEPTVPAESTYSAIFNTNNNNYVVGYYYIFGNSTDPTLQFIGRITNKTTNSSSAEYPYKMTVKLFNHSASAGSPGRYPTVYQLTTPSV